MAKLNARYIVITEIMKKSDFKLIQRFYPQKANELESLKNQLVAKKDSYEKSIVDLRKTIFEETAELIKATQNTRQSTKMTLLPNIEQMEDKLSQRILTEELGNILEIAEISVTARLLMGKYSHYFLKRCEKNTSIAHKKIYEQLKQIEKQIFYFEQLEKKITQRLNTLNNELTVLNKKFPNSNKSERAALCNKTDELNKLINTISLINNRIKQQKTIVETNGEQFELAAQAIEDKRNAIIAKSFQQYTVSKKENGATDNNVRKNPTKSSRQLIKFINTHRHGIKKYFTRKYTTSTDKKEIGKYLYKHGFINKPITTPPDALDIIRLSLKNGLCSPKRYLVTDNLLSYLGMNPLRFSIKKVAELLSKGNIKTAMEWQKADKDLIAIIGLLRGAHRNDLIRIYFRTLDDYSGNNDKSKNKILNDFFKNLEYSFMQLAYPDRVNQKDKAKKFSLYSFQGLDCIKDPERARKINDALYLNELKKRINHVFDRYGYENHIKRLVKNGIPHYTVENNKGVSYEKNTVRKKKLFWKLTADAVTILNTVGQAAFACWGLIITGNPLFLLILLAAFVTNFYLFLPSQRATFIDLFVQWDMNGLSNYKKIALIAAFGASVLSGLFFAFMAYGGAVALITISGGGFLALSVGVITFIGFTSLLFAIFKSYIVNETYKSAWQYIRENLLFKGFMNMTMKQRVGYVFSWAIRTLVLGIAAIAATIYVAATLGKCYDTIVALFPKVPATLNAIFSITGGLIDMFFTLKSVMPIAATFAQFVIKATGFIFLHPVQSMHWVKDKIVSALRWATTKKEKVAPVNVPEMDKDKDYSDFWNSIGGNEDTTFNNPDRFVLPLAKIAFYTLVVLFLVPANAVGNAVTNESSSDTLVDKLDAMGLEGVSNYFLGKMIILSTLICSGSITGVSCHEETLKVAPDMDSENTEKFVFDNKASHDSLRKKADDAYKTYRIKMNEKNSKKEKNKQSSSRITSSVFTVPTIKEKTNKKPPSHFSPSH
ncbi:MAG: hypothetical protein ACX932_07140 [Gammaproteobacteria bacterium]